MTDKPAVDWRYWRHMQEVKQWEACALSLNIDPDQMHPSSTAWMVGPGRGPSFLGSSFPSQAIKVEFEKRERLLGACLFKSEHFTTVNNLVMGGRHLATVSLREFAAWGQSVELEMPPELEAMAVPTPVSKVASDKTAPTENQNTSGAETNQTASPWLVPDDNDPPPEQPWYTPARYFARQLVIDDSTLLTKRLVLADKVSRSLAAVRIFKRGGIERHAADTVLKAFANVRLG